MTITFSQPWITIFVCSDFDDLPVDVVRAVVACDCSKDSIVNAAVDLRSLVWN